MRRRGKRPGIAERHRAEPPRLFAVAIVRTRQSTFRIVTRSTDASAELIRRAIAELFELVVDRDDADVRGAGDGEAGAAPAPERGRRLSGTRRAAAEVRHTVGEGARREIAGLAVETRRSIIE